MIELKHTEAIGLTSGTAEMLVERRARPRILVAEDDADSRFMLKTLLEMKGYSVTDAQNGKEAIEMAENEPPELILIDLQLPKLNGFAVARYVRQHATLRDVPIVAISGHDQASHRNPAIAAGCNEFLGKPINFGELESLLNRFVPLTGQQTEVDRSPGRAFA